MQRAFSPVLVALTIVVCNAACVWAQQLQYDFTKDQKASYEYDIQIDTSASLISYTGIVHYNVTLVNEQLVRLTFNGGLSEQTKSTTNREPNFGKGIPRPLNLPSIFTQNNFTGKTQSKNSISMTRSGQVLTLDGTSQLPFLLGNLSLMPFEQLPVEENKTWRSDSGVSITDDSNALRYSFRPFGPFAFQPAERMQLASELSQYTIANTEAGLVTVEKTYEMKTPDTGDRESFQMTGKGVWSFDINDHFPSSTDMQYTLSIIDGNTTKTFPIKVKFKKLTEERLATIQAESKANLEKSQKLFEERKALSKAPIVGQELDELLSQLNSSKAHDKHSALIKLMQKENFDADPKLLETVRKLSKSEEHFASLADTILQKIDPVHRMNKLYDGSGFLESSELIVDSATDLFVGQIVQIRERGRPWYAADVTELHTDGKVTTRYRGWGQQKATLLRNQIQLAHKEVIQPKRPDRDSTPAKKTESTATTRTWSDSSGSFSVEATYMGINGDKVVLKKTDGKELSVQLTRLSLPDQRFVAQVNEESKKLGNPFEQ